MKRHSYGSIPKFLIALLLSALMVVGTPVTPVLAAGVPTLGNVGSSVTADAGGAAVVISPNLTLRDFPDISGASVTISSGFVAGEDRLGFTSQGGVSGIYSASTGRLALSGLASRGTYEAVLRSVTYQNTNLTTRDTRPRGITFSIDNGLAYYQVDPQIGHYYQWVWAPTISWSIARTVAAYRDLFGLQGYLVTITSAGENAVVASTLQGSAWMGATDQLSQRSWHWESGPESGNLFFTQNHNLEGCPSTGGTTHGYSNWAENKPSDGCSPADYGYLSRDGLWNDGHNYQWVEGYVVEYGGMRGDLNSVLRASTTVQFAADTTAPSITASLSGAAGQNGWYAGPVEVQLSATDDQSGVAFIRYAINGGPTQTLYGATATFNITTDGTSTVTFSATDKAGNVKYESASIKIDATKPSITGHSNRSGWSDRPVTIFFECMDATSGIASCPMPVSVTTEGANQSVTGTATDKAGNQASTSVSGINVDMTAPTISGSADRAANAVGWYNAPVTVTFICSDVLSGVAACDHPVTLGEGANQSATGSATDNAGNSASTTVSGINVDMTAPAVSYTGNAGTYTVDQHVRITCTASDALSGVASSTCVDVVGPASTFLLGANSFSASATDHAGNVGSGSTSFTVVVNVDSLSGLVQQFAPDELGNSLTSKLAAIGKGKGKSAENQIEAFVNQVRAQAGKKLTHEQAELLIRLVRML